MLLVFSAHREYYLPLFQCDLDMHSVSLPTKAFILYQLSKEQYPVSVSDLDHDHSYLFLSFFFFFGLFFYQDPAGINRKDPDLGLKSTGFKFYMLLLLWTCLFSKTPTGHFVLTGEWGHTVSLNESTILISIILLYC